MPVKKFTKHNEIEGLFSIQQEKFSDERGLNSEIYQIHFEKDVSWKLDAYSVSKKSVLRGLHYDDVNAKLIQCLFGKIQLVVLDDRQESPTFNGIKEFILDYDNPTQILVPKGVANGHLVLSDNCVFYYKWSKEYQPQNAIKWNDSRITDRIKWMVENPILSERDK